MPLPKAETVASLVQGIKATSGVYLADFTGITVGKVTILRRTLRSKGISMKVVKNTLIKRALKESGITGLDKQLKGPTAIILADGDDPMAPAKLLVEFLKKNENAIKLKTVSIDGAAYPGSRLEELSKMPGKRELQAQVVSLALGPGQKLLGIIKGPGAQIAGQIKALAEKLGNNEPIAEGSVEPVA